MWGATFLMVIVSQQPQDFNPRSPCGERHQKYILNKSSNTFQSTLPVWGATNRKCQRRKRTQNFNPRSPCGERRILDLQFLTPSDFNPRSPCGERHSRRRDILSVPYFNPRSPCGERQPKHLSKYKQRLFQSTLPVWGATVTSSNMSSAITISIHAPRVGSDNSS